MLATPHPPLPSHRASALLSVHSTHPVRQHGLVWPRRSTANRAAVLAAASSGGTNTDPAPSPSAAEAAGETDGLLPDEDFVVS